MSLPAVLRVLAAAAAALPVASLVLAASGGLFAACGDPSVGDAFVWLAGVGLIATLVAVATLAVTHALFAAAPPTTYPPAGPR